MHVRDPAHAGGTTAEATNHHRHAARSDLRRAGAAIVDQDLEHGARAITAVINASTKLQQLRNRAIALESALARMKTRQAGSTA